MISFVRRPLSGFYKGSLANQLSDYLKIDNSFLEIARDLPGLDQRITTLESNAVGILATSNFQTNSISGTVILDNSVNGTKITDGTITGDKIVINSVIGLTDANLSSAANINPAKINLALLSHTDIKDIGSNSHPDIDNKLDQLFHDVGSTYPTPLPVPLQDQVTATSAALVSTNSSLANLSNFVGAPPLSTSAQVVSSAINELTAGLASIGASGFGISGPVTSALNSITKWSSTNGHSVTDSLAFLDGTGNLTFTNAVNVATAANPLNFVYAKVLNPGTLVNLEIDTETYIGMRSPNNPSSGQIRNYIGNPYTNTLSTKYVDASGNEFSSLGLDNTGNQSKATFSSSARNGLKIFTTVGDTVIAASGYSNIDFINPSGSVIMSPASFKSSLPILAAKVGTQASPIGSGYFDSMYANHAYNGVTHTDTIMYSAPTGDSALVIMGSGVGAANTKITGVGQVFLMAPDGLTYLEVVNAALQTMALTAWGNINITSTTGDIVMVANNQLYLPDSIRIPISGMALSQGPDADVEFVKYNRTAVSAPTVNNDSTGGYAPGSVWINTVAEDAYMCIKNTVGAAVWKKLTP